MNEKGLSLQEIRLQRCNRLLVIWYTVISAVLVIAYLTEVLSGARTIQYYLTFIAFAVIPNIIAWIAYRKSSISPVATLAALIGYLLVFAFTLFTSPYAVAVSYIFVLFVLFAENIFLIQLQFFL